MRQLSLFKGKRQRGVRPPPAPEFNSHVFVADLLRRWANPAWRWTHIPSGEHREHRIDRNGRRWSPSGQRLQRMGLKPGFPDFVFFGPARAVFLLELKRERKGRVSDAQDDVFGALLASGFDLVVAVTVDEATAALKARGILRSTFEVQ
jgi:hypothetical protein